MLVRQRSLTGNLYGTETRCDGSDLERDSTGTRTGCKRSKTPRLIRECQVRFRPGPVPFPSPVLYFGDRRTTVLFSKNTITKHSGAVHAFFLLFMFSGLLTLQRTPLRALVLCSECCPTNKRSRRGSLGVLSRAACAVLKSKT